MVFNIINLIEIVISLNSPTFSPFQSTLRFAFLCISTSFFRYAQKTLVVRPAMLLPLGKKDSLFKKELSIFAVKDFAFAGKQLANDTCF